MFFFEFCDIVDPTVDDNPGSDSIEDAQKQVKEKRGSTSNPCHCCVWLLLRHSIAGVWAACLVRHGSFCHNCPKDHRNAIVSNPDLYKEKSGLGLAKRRGKKIVISMSPEICDRGIQIYIDFLVG